MPEVLPSLLQCHKTAFSHYCRSVYSQVHICIIDPIGLIFRIFKTLFDGSKGLNIRFIAVLLAIGPRPESVSNSEDWHGGP
jgi:hypothetical protein